MNMQLTLASRYLLGRKLRTALTVLAIAFGVLLIYGLNSIMPSFQQACQANALALASQVDASLTIRTGAAFPAATLDRVTAIDGVRTAIGTLERSLGLPADFFDHDPATPDRVAAVTLVLGVAFGVFIGGGILRRLKRGRPDTWLYRQLQWRIATRHPLAAGWVGGHVLISRSGFWTTRRSTR